MSLAAFEDAARAHFANPPATWRIQPAPDSSWDVVDNHGAIVESCRTEAQAERHRHNGPAAARWHGRTDWYLGDDSRGRALSAAEQLIVADIVELVAQAEDAVRRAAAIRPVRFGDQDAADARIWVAARRPDGRYQVHGDYFHTYEATDLDFLDDQAAEDLTTFLCALLQAGEPVAP
jgi:hypothetical protein